MGREEDFRGTLGSTLAWSRTQGYQGWDPYDAMRSPFLRSLTLGIRPLGILLVQLLKNSPINLRPFLAVRPGRNPKGIGLFLATYLRWRQLGGGEEAELEARRLARWLRWHACEGWHGACWGFDFDWPNRSFFAPAGTPTVVNTVFIAHAFLDGYEMLRREDWLELAAGSCQFILDDLNRLEEDGAQCFSYTPLDRRWVHNANALAASLLARVGRLLDRASYIEEADKAVRFTIGHQRPDGSWAYGTAAQDGWIDSYHTGFTLNALRQYADSGGRIPVGAFVERGYRWYKENCFDGPVPRMRPSGRYPIDIHCAAQGILTFLAFRSVDSDAGGRAKEIAEWTLDNLLGPQGVFHFQINPLYVIRIPYLRWSQAWMARALVELLGAERKAK